SRTYDIVGVFRLAPVKRPDVFINVIAHVAQRHPELRAAIIGDGRMMSDLCKQTREKGLDGRLEFVGHQEDVPVWLSRSKTFLLTSDSEGVALSVMEALAAGTPVVASDVGDLADVVVNGGNGFLTPRRQVQGYAEKLSLLLDDPSLRALFAQHATISATAFSIEATTCRWHEILHSI
ncbi:MAG: glycosyltransferase family 4 protein, partial [Phycisphaerales bacterium]|nr:glycosyltransferase family 4 protein [Phycisphaerales bacterium]